MVNANWTKEQTIVALNLYCKIPFKKVASNHPAIIELATLIGRTPNSVKMKIGNFGSFDPELKKLGIVGLTNASKLDEIVWSEFNSDWEKLAYESELLIAKFADRPLEKNIEVEPVNFPTGLEKEAFIKQRVNQNFFRATVLSSYNFRCCVTGLSVVDLLVASHIVPWATDPKNRLNPRNGLCLNAIHDKAFDRGLITVSNDYRIIISKRLREKSSEEVVARYFTKHDGQKLFLPDRFLPSLEFLEFHQKNRFIF